MNDAFRLGLDVDAINIDILDHGAYADLIAGAIDAGYRHLGCSQIGDTEPIVRDAIRRSGVDRDELTVATKIHPRDLGHADVARSADESRQRLGVEVIDLLYVHAPKAAYDPAGTLAAFDALVDRGIVRNVGVAHFDPEQLLEAVERLECPLYAHQVERHPLLRQRRLLQLAHDHDHWLVAATPLLRGFVAEIAEVLEVADRRGLTPFEVTLAWHHNDPRVATLAHSQNAAHLRSNLAAGQLALSPDEQRVIDGIERSWRLFFQLGT